MSVNGLRRLQVNSFKPMLFIQMSLNVKLNIDLQKLSNGLLIHRLNDKHLILIIIEALEKSIKMSAFRHSITFNVELLNKYFFLRQ